MECFLDVVNGRLKNVIPIADGRYHFTINKKTGEVIYVPGSTATLTTIEFNEFIEKCQKFAAEYLGIVIADPNSQVSLW